ncbi:glycoside hydrolase family 88 protein [Paenibacillus sp. NPDC055715]
MGCISFNIPCIIQHRIIYRSQREQPWCNPEAGCSKNFWGRSSGWFDMALVGVLGYIPEDHADRPDLLRMLKETLEALLEVRDEESGDYLQGHYRRDGTFAYYTSEPIVTNDPKGIGAFI